MGKSQIAQLLALILSVSELAAAADEPKATLIVCPGCVYKTITEAIASAPAGGTINISAGVYTERNIAIQKPLRIVGDPNGPKPVVDAGGEGSVFLVRAANVEISGLSIRNSGLSNIDDLAGIKIMDSERCKILNNELSENMFGIFLGKSNYCLIEGNRVSSKRRGTEGAGNGIHIWYGNGMVVMNNHTENNRDGIYFEFVSKSRIIRNTSIGNSRYGLHFMFSNDDEYIENNFERNGSGVAVMYSNRIRMYSNVFQKSLGPAAYGILLKDIATSDIRNNVFRNNTVGAFMEGTTRSNLSDNTFSENGWGVRVLGSSDENVFEKNNFLSNTFDISTNATSTTNRFTGNYWDSYRGVDLDRDGIADDPYHPVRLSSYLMEKYGVTVLLIKSFLFFVIDQAESALPVLTPATFRDEKPLMKKI